LTLLRDFCGKVHTRRGLTDVGTLPASAAARATNLEGFWMTRTKVSILSSLAISLIAFAANEKAARADEPIGLSIGLERVGGLAYSNIKPSGSDTFSLTSFSIAGVSANPVALPRLGGDVILPFGLTLGGAVAFGYASLSDSPSDGSASTSIHGSAWLISPRVGYRFRPASFIDITPHLGATFADASLSEPISNCSFDSSGNSTCTNGSASTSVFLVAISAEVVAALRMTKTFNLLAGVSYDHVISASGSNSASDGSGNSASSSADVSGRYLGAQLWFGLGGYVF
jgi:hypothetical protein